MTTNRAAWQEKPGVKLDIRAAPYTAPQENELVVKVHAWAINPIDKITQEVDLSFVKYPLVTGMDLAGEVVEVGSNVESRFSKGDRVLAMTDGALSGTPSQSAFQEYVVAHSVLASPIPDAISYPEAVVFPLTLATAAVGLFQKDFLGLQLPSTPPRPATGKTVLIWGGASAVGCNAIQLCTAAGYNVITTASPANFDYLKSLGASAVFDYKSPTVVEDVVAAINETDLAGILHAAGSVAICLEVSGKANGSAFVAASLPIPEDGPAGVKGKMIFANTIKANEVGPAVFRDFLPEALRNGSYRVAPEPLVVGTGLESIQEGLEVWRKGVSARKIVITR
ncbi:hypothetical protein ASPWEDRAFT_113996 [Aspergillus wentii DTO 134E9]|uniref:Enoyl reductase (ER) domain-containing protein n=1 Tax=Aspergillus wentii DTO 134E9 TaxID=1073089 RepID=A0A1L9RFS3_ASPWE|nr:uncharacterized protein ASPWEDRAFT_113996 [Aspergillus wentii DTO 134E9]KAI9925537.1 hypothetical protein MW887_005918 [Aspergillus wentii]OJJ33779.1 hypothetical protein ASPWEDRAFT_113996 [Aspergillus wentii DTO 134E9]